MRKALGALALAAVALVSTGPVTTTAEAATCANKAGRGWASDIEGARFQAWEAVLQDTDWGMWAAWMASSAKVGTAASGYTVSNMREKCGNDGSSKVCTIQAKLCK